MNDVTDKNQFVETEVKEVVTVSPTQEVMESDKKETAVSGLLRRPKTLVLSLVLIVFVVITLWFSIYQGLVANPFSEFNKPTATSSVLTSVETVVVSPTPETEIVVATTAAMIVEKDILLEITNGTGVAGQAGKASDLLKDLGFKDVVLKNATETDDKRIKTEVIYSKGIDSETIKKIKARLMPKFTLVEDKEASGEAAIDAKIELITGKEK